MSTSKTRRASSEERIKEILEAGRIMLSEEGYSELSLRKVAAKAGIHLKTLQHYFPSKEELIQSILEYTDSLYSAAFEQLRLKSSTPTEHFKSYINYLIVDDKDKQTAGFFYQLWARAHSDEHAQKIMRKMYSNHSQNIANLMQPLNPDLPEQVRKERAYMIASLIDGAMLHIGHGKKRPAGINDFEKGIVELALNLASNN